MAQRSHAAERSHAAQPAHAGIPYPLWRTAALPVLALLGAVLPLVFVPQLGDFLFYFRGSDLTPAYGTAWLFLAALALPLGLAAALALKALGASPRLRWARDALAVGLYAAAAAGALAAIVYCLIVWLQTFGWLAGISFRGNLFWPAMLAGAVLGCTARGRHWIEQTRPVASSCVVLGALCALSVPFFSWEGRAAPSPSDTAAAAAPDSPAREPNIVLLTLDALSAEHMSLYGAARPTTPMLTAFAQTATTFDQAYANANFTTPGVASILTGTRPWTNRALQLPSWPALATRRDSLPALLQRRGYQLGYVSTNSAAGADKNGLGSYFDFRSRDRIKDLDLCSDSLSAIFRYACPVAAMPFFSEVVNLAAGLHGGRDPLHYDPQLAIDPAIAWLQRADKAKPIFLWVHFFPPHSPYVAPAPWLGRFDSSEQGRDIAATEPHWGYSMGQLGQARVQLLAGRYDESVQYADYYAGEFLQRALQMLGPHTVVIVTADHGESFRHGYGAHTGPGLFNELIRIPLIIKLPGQAQPIRSPTVVEQVDIAPTLAQLAGIRPPAIWEGHSLLGAWEYPDPLPDDPAFSMNFEQNPRYSRLSTGSIAVIDGRWKLVHYMGHLHYPQMPPLHDTLYDLQSDPGESTDLAARNPTEVTHLLGLISTELTAHSGAIN